MRKGTLAGIVVVFAGATGYWMFSDSAPEPRQASQSVGGENFAAPADDGPNEVFTAQSGPELIDLSRVFEPTGQELDLEMLLESTSGPEYLSMPRVAEFRIADAAEEPSSPAAPLGLLGRQLAGVVCRKLAELVCGSLPLQGVESSRAGPE